MRLKRFLNDERGNVESSLVIVPLTILFLVGMQLAVTVYLRNDSSMQIQSETSTRALSGDFQPGDSFIHIESSGDSQNLDLLVAKRSSKLADLIPTFLGGATANRNVEVQGIAIVENQR